MDFRFEMNQCPLLTNRKCHRKCQNTGKKKHFSSLKHVLKALLTPSSGAAFHMRKKSLRVPHTAGNNEGLNMLSHREASQRLTT